MLKLAGIVVLTASLVQAAPFAKTFRFKQPDGTRIEVWGQGDEFSAVFEHQGYTVVMDPARKTYTYARLSADGSELIPTRLDVGKADPQTSGLPQHLRVSPEAAAAKRKARFERWDVGMEVTRRWDEQKIQAQLAERLAEDGPVMAPPAFTTTGTKVGLCLLIDFVDDPATIPQADIFDYCNGDDYTGYGNAGSIKQYFLDNSKNLLTYTNVVTAYIRMAMPKSYYNDITKDSGSQANKMIRDALDILKALPNYTTEILPSFSSLTVNGSKEIMACNVFYAGDNGGNWSFGLWPHSWSLYEVGAQELSAGGMKVNRYQVTNIGDELAIATFCHENGHMLCGYPDLYDYNYDSSGGAGDFCLMGTNSDEKNPSQFCAYLKRASGWATTVTMNSYWAVRATLTATMGEPGFNRFYKFTKPGVPTEYYLFENRQQTGRDASIPGSGLCIWHVDERGSRDDQRLAYNTYHWNFECTLVTADNQWQLHKAPYEDLDANSGDVFDLFYAENPSPAYSNVFSDASAPSARWWDGTDSLLEITEITANGPDMGFIQPIPPEIVSPDVLPPGRMGKPYTCTLSAVRGALPYVWVCISNAPPAGLTLSAEGVISGMPAAPETTEFLVTVTGDNGMSDTNLFSLTIRPPFGTPYEETFESGGLLPDSWTQSFVVNSQPWVFRNGNGATVGHPVSAYRGSYNACLAVVEESQVGSTTLLESPMIDFGSGVRAARLTFWHQMSNWEGGQDELRIYYKTTYGGEWTLITTFSSATEVWTQRTVELPNPNRTYYLAFEGVANYGYGIHIDDVRIFDPTPPLGMSDPEQLPDAYIERFYSHALTPVGGAGPTYTFALAGGALPTGMVLSADGVISGTVATVQSAQFTVQVSDAEASTATATFRLDVEQPPVNLFAEDFEHYGNLPAGWTQEYVENSLNWYCLNGGGDGDQFHQPLSAHGGGYNAVLFFKTADVFQLNDNHTTRLITPEINLGAAPANIRLIFWHCMTQLDSSQDELKIYYKTSAAGAWNLLASYTANVADWTKRTVLLPTPTSTYYLAFEGNARFGNGVCIDDVRITDEASAPVITTLSPLPSGLVGMPYSYTMAASGGVEPYTWSVVLGDAFPGGLSISSDGVISGTPTWAETPQFRLRVMGADGYASTNLFSLQVNQVQRLPYTQNFENGGAIPFGWSQESTFGSLSWTFRSGSPAGVPAAPHGGQQNACLFVDNTVGYMTRLVSPMLDLGVGTTNTLLTFWHCMANYQGDQDELKVWYKNTTNGAWELLAHFNTDTPTWTQRTIALPNPTTTYFIAFEGIAKYGYGVCVDDVTVTGDYVLTGYEAWKNLYFTNDELLAGLLTGDEDDPDGDGIPNGLEFAMGFNPRVADTEGLPFGGVTAGYLTLSFRMDKNALLAGTDYVVESCTNLVNAVWTTNEVSEVARADSNTWWQSFYRHDVPVTNAPQRFLRLKVYLP